MQSLARFARSFMNRGVADAPEVVKERALRRADHVALKEAVHERLLGLAGVRKKTHLRGGALREQLREQAQLREAHRGVGREELLGLRRERDEPRIVMR